MSTPLVWTQVEVLVPLGWHELVAETLAVGPTTSVVIGQTGTGPAPPPVGFEVVRTFLSETADTPAARRSIEDALRTLAQRAAVHELADLRATFKRLPREDYADSWKQSWKPFRVRNLCVVPPFGKPPGARVGPGEIELLLEPGGAFGTGRHATTRTCLKVIAESMRGGERVLDAGCGSGILGVAAALLGADAVFGFDSDPVALPYAQKLSRDNGVAERCEFRTGGFELLEGRGAPGPFDVVCANLYSDLIEAHALELAGALRPGGWFVFSGCPWDHSERVRGAVRGAGLTLGDERRRGRWVTLAGAK